MILYASPHIKYGKELKIESIAQIKSYRLEKFETLETRNT